MIVDMKQKFYECSSSGGNSTSNNREGQAVTALIMFPMYDSLHGNATAIACHPPLCPTTQIVERIDHAEWAHLGLLCGLVDQTRTLF